MGTVVRRVDRGAARLAVTVQASQARPHVRVGVLEAEGAKQHGADDLTVADVARWAEFGIGQPQRSWLRGTVAARRAQIEERMRIESRAVLEGKRTQEQALSRLGVFIVGLIQERIAAGIDPPNAQATIDRKGSSTPLIDTGQLRSSITSQYRPAGG